MHYWLKNAVKNIVARAERTDVADSTRAATIARAGRVLLLHNPSNDLAEKWIDEHGQDPALNAAIKEAL